MLACPIRTPYTCTTILNLMAPRYVLMEERTFSMGNLNRPKNSRKIIRTALSRVDCIPCGICCTSAKGVTVPKGSAPVPHVRSYLRDLGKLKKLAPAPNDCFTIEPDENGCPILSEDSGRITCGIYGNRPFFCEIFPLVMRGLEMEFPDGERGVIAKLVLTSRCPPVKEIFDKGVAFVSSHDLLINREASSRDENIPLMCENNLLGQCLTAVLRDIGEEKEMHVSMEHLLISKEAEFIFPIF